MLMLQLKTLTINEIIATLKQYEANETLANQLMKKEQGECVLYARGGRGGLK